jgi:ferredoxin-NADP reductase
MEQTSSAVLGPVEPSVRPHALAHARARVSMLGAGDHIDTVNRALDEHARVLDKANSYIVDNARLAEQVESLRAALQWYADGLHFDKASPDAWDTVSGEPQNWWCDEAGTATVEDGSIAAMVLRGELTGAQVQALD